MIWVWASGPSGWLSWNAEPKSPYQMVDSTAIGVVAPFAGTFMLGRVCVLRRSGTPPPLAAPIALTL